MFINLQRVNCPLAIWLTMEFLAIVTSIIKLSLNLHKFSMMNCACHALIDDVISYKNLLFYGELYSYCICFDCPCKNFLLLTSLHHTINFANMNSPYMQLFTHT